LTQRIKRLFLNRGQPGTATKNSTEVWGKKMKIDVTPAKEVGGNPTP